MNFEPANAPRRSARTASLPQAWSPSGGPIATLIMVRPDSPGWSLRGEDLEPVFFASGAAAERHGRRLARSLASLGRDAQVNVYDASGRLAGTIRYFGSDADPERQATRAAPWTH